MSVLFDALNKAKPHQERVLEDGPNFFLYDHLVNPDTGRRRLVLFTVLVAVCLSVATLSFYAGSQRQAEQSLPPSTVAPNTVVQPVPAQKEQNASDGIFLAQEESQEKELAIALEETPAFRGEVTAEEQSDGDVPVPSQTLERAQEAIEKQDWRSAIVFFDAVLRLDRTNNAAIDGKIFALEQIGGAYAVNEMSKMISRYPRRASFYAAKGRVLAQSGRLQAALAAWKQAARLEPDHVTYRIGLAVMYDKLGQQKEALAVYRSLPDTVPDDVKARRAYLAQISDNRTPR